MIAAPVAEVADRVELRGVGEGEDGGGESVEREAGEGGAGFSFAVGIAGECQYHKAVVRPTPELGDAEAGVDVFFIHGSGGQVNLKGEVGRGVGSGFHLGDAFGGFIGLEVVSLVGFESAAFALASLGGGCRGHEGDA